MSKAQLATEPSMEDILASIRKMIADDKPQRSPLPDSMGRTPFGPYEPSAPTASDEFTHSQNPASANAAEPGFNSLADALKAASALSDQRRGLDAEAARETVDGERSSRDFAPKSSARENAGPLMPSFPDRRPETGSAPANKREPVAFDFNSFVPQRDSGGAGLNGTAKPAAISREEKPAAATGNPAISDNLAAKSAETTKPADAPARQSISLKGESAPEHSGASRLNGNSHSSSANGSAAPGPALNGALNGSGTNGSTVAPFPRLARDMPKPAPEPVREAAADKPSEPKSQASPVVASELKPAAREEAAKAAPAEALVDAVVDLVQKQPGALSVFNSGASFISGVVAKPLEGGHLSPAPAKLDRAAAELLRPMLRQWLSDNMPRIVEEALRSELQDQTGDSKDPEKS